MVPVLDPSIVSAVVASDIERLERSAYLAPGVAVSFDPVRRIRELVEGGRIQEARLFLASLYYHRLFDHDLQKWERVLAPPVARRVPATGQDPSNQFAWLRSHAEVYRGKWVALDRKGLVAAADSLGELRKEIAGLSLAEPPLIQKL